MKQLKQTYLVPFILFVFLLSSCKQEADDVSPGIEKVEVFNKNGRLVFKDSKAVFSTFKQLQNKQTSYLDKWEKSLGFSSLRKFNAYNIENQKLESFDLPGFYSSIINENGEYQIGDTIVWLNNGFKHFIPNKNEELLARIKRNPDSNINKIEEGSKVLSSKSSEVAVQSLNPGQIDARYQKEFNLDNGGGKRKIVFELHNYSFGVGPGTVQAILYTRIKLEYLGSKGWKPAGETMAKGINELYYTINYRSIADYPITESSPYPINIPEQIDGSNLEYVIFSAHVSSRNPGLNVYVNGNYHASVYAPNHSQGIYNINAIWSL